MTSFQTDVKQELQVLQRCGVEEATMALNKFNQLFNPQFENMSTAEAASLMMELADVS